MAAPAAAGPSTGGGGAAAQIAGAGAASAMAASAAATGGGGPGDTRRGRLRLVLLSRVPIGIASTSTPPQSAHNSTRLTNLPNNDDVHSIAPWPCTGLQHL